MSFNINYFGGTYDGLVPLNPDSWLKANNKFPDKFINKIPINNNWRYSVKMTTSDLLEAYWTVRSFKVDIRVASFNLTDAFTEFMLGGGLTFTAVGALAGLQASTNSYPDGIFTKGYTKIYHRNYKTITKKNTGKERLVPDETVDPNPKECFNYKINEGNLVSPGPVHIFESKDKSIIVKIDFSDIIYKRNFYYPNITIAGRTSKFGFTNQSVSAGYLHYGFFMNSLIPIYVVNFKKSSTGFPVIFCNINIQPGDRCCDRFFWDGKDKKREIDCESCNDKQNIETEKDGVYYIPSKL